MVVHWQVLSVFEETNGGTGRMGWMVQISSLKPGKGPEPS